MRISNQEFPFLVILFLDVFDDSVASRWGIKLKLVQLDLMVQVSRNQCGRDSRNCGREFDRSEFLQPEKIARCAFV